jgi:hypothetical protein
MLECPSCHFDNEDGALFCEQCKSDLSAPHSPVPALAPAAVAVEALPFAPLGEAVAPGADALVAEAALAVPVAEATVQEVVSAPPAVAVAFPVAEPMSRPDPEPAPADAAPSSMAAGTATMQGSVAPSSPPPAPATPTPLPPGVEPKLVVVRGLRMDVEYPLYRGPNFLGRADEKPVDIDLEDQESPDRVYSSRQHAVITFEDGLLTIEDLNSANGTFVNRTRVYPGQKRPLQVNDVLQLGTVQMRVKA